MIIPLFETHYNKNAIRDLINAGWDEELANDLITSLYKKVDGHDPLIHAFVHSGEGTSWLPKYLLGIARMYDEQTGGDEDKIEEFKRESTPIFDEYLMWVRDNRKDNSLDDEFNKKMSYQDVVDKVEEIQSDKKKKSDEEMSKMTFSTSNYELVPIKSYQHMHKLFGGNKTGNGEDEEGEYAGSPKGGTAWCHTNNEGTYNSYVNGDRRFFVLMNKDFEKIPFDAKSNAKEHGKDAYGNSLLAILTDKYGNLKKVTLRCNHEGVPSKPDNQYETYAELSKIAGFNVEQEVAKYVEETRPEDEFFIFDSDWDNCLIGVKKPAEKMIIPDYVESIDDGAFENQIMIKEIVLPQGLKTIGRNAFAHCTSLEKINFPDTLKNIKEGAFNGCIELKEAVINVSIMPYTFEDCYSLEKVEIGNGCYYINSRAFSNCLELEDITIPASVSTIGNQAFAGCSLTKINIPRSVSYIGEQAFTKCLSLEEVNIEGFASYGDGVFASCKNLEKVHLSDDIDSIAFGMFNGCTNLKEINIPSSCEVISGNAFYKCSSLKEIVLPDSLKRIGDNAFKETPLLQSNKDFDIINDIVVQYNGVDNDVVIPEGAVKLNGALFENASIETITLPKSLKVIGQSCFSMCVRLRKINFSMALERIEEGAFKGCKSLKEVELPPAVKLGNDIFMNSGLENIKLPSELISIPYACFIECRNLKQIDIPDGVRSIEQYAFSSTGLESVDIPSSVEFIRDSAFSSCNKLETVTINEGLLVIPKYCFEYCSNLTSVTIPESVMEINKYAFYNCSKLSSVTIKGDDKEIDSQAFDNTPYQNKQNEKMADDFDSFLKARLSKSESVRPLKLSLDEGYNRTKLDL